MVKETARAIDGALSAIAGAVAGVFTGPSELGTCSISVAALGSVAASVSALGSVSTSVAALGSAETGLAPE